MLTYARVRCLLYHLFLFKCYVAHRDLHSFPTRRSSDLGMESDADMILKKQHLEALKRLKEANEHAKRLLAEQPDAKDRKSTRLNSSHVSISYAVFCLKKKKKLNENHNIIKIDIHRDYTH